MRHQGRRPPLSGRQPAHLPEHLRPKAHATGESSPQFQHVNQSANRGARFISRQVAHCIERTSAGATGRGQLQATQRQATACRPGASRSTPALRHSVCPQRGQVGSAMRKLPGGWPDMPIGGLGGYPRPRTFQPYTSGQVRSGRLGIPSVRTPPRGRKPRPGRGTPVAGRRQNRDRRGLSCVWPRIGSQTLS